MGQESRGAAPPRKWVDVARRARRAVVALSSALCAVSFLSLVALSGTAHWVPGDPLVARAHTAFQLTALFTLFLMATRWAARAVFRLLAER